LNNLGWKLFNALFPRTLESFARFLTDEAAKNRFMNQLDKYLTRTDDRALFNLKPLPEKTATPKEVDLETLQKINPENEPTKTETPKN
jgi:hypothetical protein